MLFNLNPFLVIKEYNLNINGFTYEKYKQYYQRFGGNSITTMNKDIFNQFFEEKEKNITSFLQYWFKKIVSLESKGPMKILPGFIFS